MNRIDAHAHVSGDDPQTIAFLESLGVKILNICVASGAWRADVHPLYRALAGAHPDRYAWCTSFDLPDCARATTDYADHVIEALRADFRDGAVAVKAWKNIGMELVDPDGAYVLIDDPMFTPIFDFLSRESRPIVMHIGEPLACWLPLDPRSPHYGYYRDNPRWHLEGRTDVPTHGQLIDARDRVVERHPKLRVIGAHLGSLEHDVALVARRLDRFPNFAVDISARLGDLMRQPRDTVASFFTSYAGRIIFGTDIVSRKPFSSLTDDERARVHSGMRATYDAYTRYLESDEIAEWNGHSARGLALEPGVMKRICSANAREWYPGL